MTWIGFGLVAAAVVIALVVAVRAWPMSAPVGTNPATPLWEAPGVPGATRSADRSAAAPGSPCAESR